MPDLEFASRSAYDLLDGAARAIVPIDQRWLHALVDEPEKTLPDILRYAAEDHSDDRIPLEQDLISIFQYLKTPLGVPYLINLIRADPTEIRDELVEALVQIGSPAIEPLLKLYEEAGESNGAEIAFLLAGMGIKDPRILELLMNRLALDWNEGLFHLEIYRDANAIPRLEQLALTVSEDERRDIDDTIKDLREPSAEALPIAFDIWNLYPARSDPDYDLASEADRVEILNSPSPETRAHVASSFFGAEYSVETRAKLFDLARNDPDPTVRARSWEALLDFASDPELRRGMQERLADRATSNIERAGLVVALSQHADQPEVRQAILDLVEDPETRSKALEAMWRALDGSFGEVGAAYIEDPDSDVQRSAMWVIGYLNVQQHSAKLPKFFDIEELRPDALHNYALASPGPTTRKKMTELLDKIDDLAGGLVDSEVDLVKAGIDIRLSRAGLKPLFTGDEDEEPEAAAPKAKVGRNDPCPCGSGKKYKKCCGQ